MTFCITMSYVIFESRLLFAVLISRAIPHALLPYSFLYFFSMNTPASIFTVLYPKRGDIIGSTKQAFGAGTVFRSTLVNAIRANTVLAIGTIALETMQVQ